MTWHSESDAESTRKGSHTGIARTASGSESPATTLDDGTLPPDRPAVQQELTHEYEAICFMCGRPQWSGRLTRLAASRARPQRCFHCRGWVQLVLADAGTIGSVTQTRRVDPVVHRRSM